MKTKLLIIVVLFPIILLGCLSTNGYSRNISMQISYDENGKPITTNNLFIVNLAGTRGNVIVYNATDSNINVHYERDGKWTIIGDIKSNDSLVLFEQNIQERSNICLEYLGMEYESFTIDFEKKSYDSRIILGYPVPSWNGESFEPLMDKIVKSNFNNRDINFIVQSIATGTPNSAGGVDIRINFWNTSKKTIKYVYFTVEPYNKVDDATVSTIDGKSLAVVKVVDYIEPNKNFDATWKNVWYNSSIKYSKIKNVRIVYKDGSEYIINENSLDSICGINPMEYIIYQNDDIEIKYSYNNGRVYYNVISDLNFEKFNIHFETAPKTIYSKLNKNISVEFTNLNKSKSILDGKGIQAIHPNSSNDLLFELLSMTISYKKIEGIETIINISDEEIINNIKNYAYVIDMLGLQ